MIEQTSFCYGIQKTSTYAPTTLSVVIATDVPTSATTTPPSYDEKTYRYVTDYDTGKTCEAFDGDCVLTRCDLDNYIESVEKEKKLLAKKPKKKWYRQFQKHNKRQNYK